MREQSLSTNKKSHYVRSKNVIHFVAYLLTDGMRKIKGRRAILAFATN